MSRIEELKEWIDIAIDECGSMEEFRAFLLEKYNVKTRLTENILSFRHPELKVSYRGKTLGEKYEKWIIEGLLDKKIEIKYMEG